MKLSLVAALVVVCALVHGGESMVKREVNDDIERLTKYFQDLSTMLTQTTQDVVEKLKTHEFTNQAQTYLEDGKTKLQPLAEKIQEQLKPLASNIEEQLKPLADSVQAQLRPLADSVQTQVEELLNKMIEQTKAIGQ